MGSRKIALGLSLAVALLGAAMWAYTHLQASRGHHQIDIRDASFGSGGLSVVLMPGKLHIGRSSLYYGTRQNHGVSIGIPKVASYSYRISDGGFWVLPPGRTNLFECWDLDIHWGGFLALASIYPAIVWRRYRNLLLMIGLIAAAMTLGSILLLAADVLNNPDLLWKVQYRDRLIQLLLIAIPTCSLFWWSARCNCTGLASACSTCGYDLTGNVSGICPECGKATSSGVV